MAQHPLERLVEGAVGIGQPSRVALLRGDRVAKLIPLLPVGTYTVNYRVTSADGHPVRGAFTFKVGPNPGPPPRFVIRTLVATLATVAFVLSAVLTMIGAGGWPRRSARRPGSP